MRSIGRLYNWDHLVFELRNAFVHPDLDNLIKEKTTLRKQQRNESFQSFYFELEKLFRSMMWPLSEEEKMRIVHKNMRTDYRKALTFIPIYDLPSLIAAGRKLDTHNFSLLNSVFGNEKTVHMITKQSERKNDTKKTANRTDPNNTYLNSSSQHHASKSPDNVNQIGDRGRNKRNEPTSTNVSANAPKVNNSTGSGRQLSTLTLGQLVAAHRPPSLTDCYNCGKSNHQHEQCREAVKIFCLICGFKGFETLNCPYCRKNGIQVDVSRPPPNLPPRT